MTSNEKNFNKNKLIFIKGNNLPSPLFNFQETSLKKDNQLNFPDINPKYNKLSPVIQNKQNTHNSQGLNKLSEISKTYSLSKPKNENKLMLSKYKLLKDSSNDYSTRIKNSRILETYSTTKNTSKTSHMNSFKNDTTSIFDNTNKNNLKILENQNINNNKGIYGIRNLKINKNINENINETNDSYNNNLLNETSSNNSNLATKRKTIGKLYVNTDISNIYLNTPKESNIKLALPKKNLDKKLVINCKNNFGTPAIRNNIISLSNTTPENKNKIKCSLENTNHKILNINDIKKNNNINTIRPTKKDHIILENIGNSNGYNSDMENKKIKIDSNKDNIKESKTEKVYKCPEELHYYYVKVLQNGKKNEGNFEGE